MTAAARVVLLAGAADPLGAEVARAVLAAGGKVAAVAPRAWQVDRLREQLPDANVLVGLVADGDSQAAAGIVKGAKDALGPITDVIGASVELRGPEAGSEPAGDLAALLERNLHANCALVRAALPALRRRGSGRLVLPALPDDPDGLSATCRASLAAVEGYALGLARDLAGAAIEVAQVPADASVERWL